MNLWVNKLWKTVLTQKQIGRPMYHVLTLTLYKLYNLWWIKREREKRGCGRGCDVKGSYPQVKITESIFSLLIHLLVLCGLLTSNILCLYWTHISQISSTVREFFFCLRRTRDFIRIPHRFYLSVLFVDCFSFVPFVFILKKSRHTPSKVIPRLPTDETRFIFL